ncbi:ArsR family transcriptional regulator [Caldanaerobius fijiensis DSM 17918]|uniref:ArsR family transcriptional regulator n=1 Tax=Caldanaerobius fijiensis DSM 17918 TaxID=1121256 RepID=A0A1M4SQX5_9THEO|nr:metalloregulator ArsR/SmtB family transcription factor [Caldanaerobius fijiensis]SHE34582.1 ArsR family transcriptional regulator [Caldanaerobius fijiensis DSM 17918]
MEEILSMVEIFKALSDPIRLRILDLLLKQQKGDEYCVCDLADEIGISQPNVSHHLKILKSAGLVRCEKSEGCSYYVVNAEKLRELCQNLNRTFLGDEYECH